MSIYITAGKLAQRLVIGARGLAMTAWTTQMTRTITRTAITRMLITLRNTTRQGCPRIAQAPREGDQAPQATRVQTASDAADRDAS